MADKMMSAMNVSQAFSMYHANKGDPKWVNANPQVFAIVTSVWKMRKESGMDWW